MIFGHMTLIPYSRKYRPSLNLAFLPQMLFLTPLEDLILAVWYGIAIRTCMWKKIWRILTWQLKGILPNFPAIRYGQVNFVIEVAQATSIDSSSMSV